MDSRVRLGTLIAPAFAGPHDALRRDAFDEYWLKGGRGSGKSTFIALELVLGLLRDPDSNAVVYRRVAATLRESVFEQLLWAIEALGLSERFRARVSPPEIERIDTGQRVLFRGADDPGKSKSIKLAKGYFRWLWFEELTEFDGPVDLRTIRASVFRGTDRRCVTFCSYNPPARPDSWVNAEALLPRPGRLVHHSTYLDLPQRWLGRSFLDQADQLRAVNARAWRHMYLGEVTGTGGEVFDNLALRPIAPEELEALHSFHNGLDFGFAADPDALVRAAFEPRTRRLFLLEEFVATRTPAEALAERALAICGREPVRCDSAEPRMIQALRERGVQAVGVKKGPGSVAHGIRWLQALGGIVIDPARCPEAAREFSGYAYPPDGRGGFRGEYPDRDNHTIDAVRYALEPLIHAKTARSVDRARIGL